MATVVDNLTALYVPFTKSGSTQKYFTAMIKNSSGSKYYIPVRKWTQTTTNYTYSTSFTSAGTFSWVAPHTMTVSVTVAGGGQGGGVGSNSSNGAAGEQKTYSVNVVKGNVYTVVVGGGGAGATWENGGESSDYGTPAGAGGNSYFYSTSYIAKGGGNGGSNTSGGAGGARNSNDYGTAGSGKPGWVKLNVY